MFTPIPRPTHSKPTILILKDGSKPGTSISNIRIECDSLGIHYEVSTLGKDRVSIISKWNRDINEMEEVGRIEYTFLQPTKVRIGANTEWKILADWLVNTKGPLAVSRSFIGGDGRQYRWRTKHMDTKLVMYAADAQPDAPGVAFYNRVKRGSHLRITEFANLEVYPEAMNALDSIIISFLIMEKKRRERD